MRLEGVMRSAGTGLLAWQRLGTRLMTRVPAVKWGRREVQVTLPGATAPFTIRPRSTDLGVIHQVFVERQYDLSQYPHDRSVRIAFQKILDAGSTPLIIDAGANNGASATWFALQFPQARIVAIEPDPENAALCRRNTSGYRVEVVQAAIGGSDGRATVLNDGVGKSAVTTARDAAGTTEIVSVGALCQRFPADELFAVKIDIEGFERDLFAGSLDWLDTVALVFIEPHDWMLPGSRSSSGLQKAFGDRDFDLLLCGENLVYVSRRILARQ